ncbi:MAG: M23 family metallopeptidase [Oculatellaceae cyanobacterium bins.114]|nr:M23 family metallopeptidase [Oculatellaceae cyanobacterium bins.114]
MMHNKKVRFGRMLLIAGVALTCFVIFETHQKMLGIAPETIEPRSPLVETPTQGISPQRPQALTPTQQPSSALAIDQGATNIAPTQVDPSQLATNDWVGASFPVENFQTYTSPFGYRRSPTGGYTQEFHYGLDMAAPEGSYIRNWWGGTVVEVSDDSNCGTSVVIESGNWLHIYCHMQGHVSSDRNGRFMIDREGGIQVWEGQEVIAGQRIGRVGMTGRTTGPHLHWGLKYDENWVDPALVLRAMYSGQQNAARPGINPVQ